MAKSVSAIIDTNIFFSSIRLPAKLTSFVYNPTDADWKSFVLKAENA